LGVDLVPLVVGLYGLAEIMNVVESLRVQIKPGRVRVRDMLPTRAELRRSPGPIFRGTIVGFLFGLLPGPSATMSSFASYRLEKSVSKHRAEMGEGAIEGVAGPETANNAAATSGWAPLLSLGIPFGSTTALVMGAMIVQGVSPGPLLMINHPEIFWGVIVSMYFGNVILLILNLPLIGVWVNLLRVPAHIFLTLILLIATIGSYSARNNMFDVYVLLVLGAIGYILQKINFKLAPLVIGFVLGPLIEKHLREALFLSLGDLSIFWGSKIAVGIWILTFFVLFFGSLRGLLGRLVGKKIKEVEIEGDL
jgi:putative tricarboxylic transport membrane protein